MYWSWDDLVTFLLSTVRSTTFHNELANYSSRDDCFAALPHMARDLKRRSNRFWVLQSGYARLCLHGEFAGRDETNAPMTNQSDTLNHPGCTVELISEVAARQSRSITRKCSPWERMACENPPEFPPSSRQTRDRSPVEAFFLYKSPSCY
ncbi:hypothetical protein PCANC_18327 [Puccinia coronata f. sp. avenae]|uniref:Uncharacterized protein n=1 Tax=Puccinia coronata f. sp. avenae TaxID=200324 RepID=A0A2N5SGG3_9BASI|nr:hypothetical protein PCANC_18327 [Puccinia coronata f. sp. avenae]